LAVATALVLLAACQSPGAKDAEAPLNTPSGQPEVMIACAGVAPIHKAAREFFLARGYVEAPSVHAYEVIFDKPVKAEKKSRALRVRLRAGKAGPGQWRVLGMSQKVEDWRSELETETGVQAGFAQIQPYLEAIKAQVEAGR
jgi:hypothetical protein